MREPLSRFAKSMELKLQKHDLDRGSRGWSNSPTDHLVRGLLNEVEELEGEINCGTPQDIMNECCDVANFAMMIFDNIAKGVQSESSPTNRKMVGGASERSNRARDQ